MVSVPVDLPRGRLRSRAHLRIHPCLDFFRVLYFSLPDPDSVLLSSLSVPVSRLVFRPSRRGRCSRWRRFKPHRQVSLVFKLHADVVAHQTSATLTQARTVRSPPPPSGLMYTRPWRSSPLAGPAFSTLPPIISESSEDEQDLVALESARELVQSRSPSSLSVVSMVSASASGYGSRNASGSASALVLVEGEASTSSISLPPSTSAHGTGTSSSQGHGNSQTHSTHRPARLSKSWGRRASSSHEDASPKNVSEVSLTPPPRARTVSRGHSRPASLPGHTVVPSPTIPPTYSGASSESNNAKQPPSISRDPSSNWMSSTPFGPATTPKFSRLAMASPAVVMPLSAREYRKQKAKEALGKGKEKDTPTSSHVPFIDNVMSAFQSPNGVPLVKVSSPPSEDVHQPSSSGGHNPDHQSPPQPQVDHPPPEPLPHASFSAQPQPRPSHPRPRSRPNTPPRSSPLAVHPPISPKSSAGTFFSLASTPDDDSTPSFPSHPQTADIPASMSSPADHPNMANAVLPARPRPRPRRRKSYPDRLSNGVRPSLLEAMNRLSQESAALHHLSGLSQIDGANRLSVASQASGHTLFYDVVDMEGEGENENGAGQRTSVLHTQSLEDLSSTLARTGIEVARPHREGDLSGTLDEERKGKRNVRVVRISDVVEVSPPPVHRRRKLTKSRPGLARGSTQGTGAVKEMNTKTHIQSQERRASLLPWKSKGSGNSKGGVVSADAASAGAGEKSGEDGPLSTPTKSVIHTKETAAPTSAPLSLVPTLNGLSHVEAHSKIKSSSTSTKKTSDTPTPTTTPAPPESSPSMPPRKARRYTFSFLPASTFPRPKREKSNTLPASVDLTLDQNIKIQPKEGVKGIESGTDSTSTSIHTITQGSESTLMHASPASSVGLSGAGRGTNAAAAVPMLRRLNAQEMEMANAGALSQSEWDGKGGSTPSLITNGSTATTSSAPRTPSFIRLSGGDGEAFVPRPSGLKESFTDTSEEDSEGVQGVGRTLRMRHRKLDQSPLACVGASGAETSGEDERVHLRSSSSPGLLGPSPRPGSRPGTSSSTLTTATETSGSYASFSTIPASTISSSSTSRSTSPSPVTGEKRERERVVSVPQCEDRDGNVHACTMCGHVVSRSTSPISLTHDLERVEMHPMFTVPLVTVPASAVSYPRSTHNTRLVGRDAVGRRGERQFSVPLSAAVGVGAKNDHNHNHMHGPVTRTTRTNKMVSSSPNVRKRPRPQTAPAGTGDVAFKFIEETKARNVGVGVGVGGDRVTKPKGGGSGESRFKTVLKGLLRWNG